MNNESLCNDIKYYQMYLKELLTDYYINESICDFYETDKGQFIRYGNCLGNITRALSYRQHMLCYLLFYEDKDSKSIPKLLNRIRDTKLLKDKELDKAIKYLANEIEAMVKSASCDIENLKEYRHKVYAHWNVNLFNTEWQKQFKKNHIFDYEKIISLSKKCIETFGVILNFLGQNSYFSPEVEKGYIDLFIKSLKD